MITKAILLKLTSGLSITVTLILIAIKGIAWLATGSMAILSSLIDSSLDLLTTLINFFAIRYSLRPDDKEFRFGYGAIEDIACLFQASFIGGSAFFIFIQSVRNLIEQTRLTSDLLGVTIMGISLILKTSFIFFQNYTVKKTASRIIKAEALNYTSDLLMDSSILISLVIIEYTKFYFIDSILAMFIAIYIFRCAYKIGIKAFNNLMSKELPKNIKKQIVDIVESAEEVKGFHKLKTRMAGSKYFVQIHLEMRGNTPLETSNRIAKQIEKKIIALLGDCEVMIHQDPIKLVDHKR